MLRLILVLAGVCTMGMALSLPGFYSYSTAVRCGAGRTFSTAHDGRGIRVWEYMSYHINGLQLGYDGKTVGLTYDGVMELTLLDNEFIVQVYEKYEVVYDDYIYIFQHIFVTNHGRMLNFYPTHDGSELRFLRVRQN